MTQAWRPARVSSSVPGGRTLCARTGMPGEGSVRGGVGWEGMVDEEGARGAAAGGVGEGAADEGAAAAELVGEGDGLVVDFEGAGGGAHDVGGERAGAGGAGAFLARFEAEL